MKVYRSIAAVFAASFIVAGSVFADAQAPQELIDFVKSLPTPRYGSHGVTQSGLPQLFTSSTEAIYRKTLQATPEEKAAILDNAARLFELYLRDAKAGDPIAEASVSRMYLPRGVGTARNEQEGFLWAKKAAEDGVPVAAVYTGSMYQYGVGTAKDTKEGARWYLKASEKLGPETAEALHKLLVQAEALVRDKDFRRAHFVLAQAVLGMPWSPAAWYNYALVSGELGRDPQNGAVYAMMAIGAMQMFMALSPDAPQARGAQDLIYEWELKAKK